MYLLFLHENFCCDGRWRYEAYRYILGSYVCDVFLCFRHFPVWYPGSGLVLDYIKSWSLPSSLLLLSAQWVPTTNIYVEKFACLSSDHTIFFFRFSSPPASMKYKQIKNGVEGFSEKPSTPFFYLPIKEKNVWKRLKVFGAFFLASIFTKMNLPGFYLLNLTI